MKYLSLLLIPLIISCATVCKKPQINFPQRAGLIEVTFVECKPGFACLDMVNAQKLGVNIQNTETYVIKLETLLKVLAEPVK